MEKNRGCSMPLRPKKRQEELISILCMMIVFCIIIGIMRYHEVMADGVLKSSERLVTILVAGFFGLLFLLLLAELFMKLRFTPEGISVTLFGFILSHRSLARMKLISPVRYRDIEKIALCSYSLKELTDRAYYEKPPLFRNSREFREGEWAHDYLEEQLYRMHSTRSKYRFQDPLIDWLWWDPERAELLRKMYPDAPWMDLTKDKYFDKQLEEYSSGKMR